MPHEERLGPQPGKDMSDHENWVNELRGGNSRVVRIHLPKEMTQFETTEDALIEGLIPFRSPRGYSIGERNFKHQGSSIVADLVLDSVDVPKEAIAYVGNVTEISDVSVNRHFNISIQHYRRTID